MQNSVPAPTDDQRIAVYAGSFDPLTHGHLYLIRQGRKLFDRLIVVIADNPAKRSSFTKDLRKVLIERTLQEEGLSDRVEVDTVFMRFIVRYASERGAHFLLRGVRNATDFEYEGGIRHINDDIAKLEQMDMETVFLMPPRELTEVSSSTVRGLVGVEGWEEVVHKYVPRLVYQRLLFQRSRAAQEEQFGLKGIGEAFFEAYTEPHRAYHSIAHLYQGWRELEAFIAEAGPEAEAFTTENYRLLLMAWWMHDLVQEPFEGKNEARSLDRGRVLLGEQLHQADASLLQELVVTATQHLQAPEPQHPLARLLHDLDLSILGQKPELYQRYKEGVAQEYSAMDSTVYQAGRAHVLRQLLDKEPLFATDYFRNKYEAAARANIQVELTELMNEAQKSL